MFNLGIKLNTFCNRIAPFLMMIITILQIAFIISGYKGDPLIEVGEGKGTIEPIFAFLSIILFLFQTVICILFALNGHIQIRIFSEEIKKKASKGFPLGGIEGFKETEKALRATFRSSYSIIIIIILALSSFGYCTLPPVDYKRYNTYNSNLFLIVSIGLLLIAFGMTLLLRMPLRPVFQPGGLMNFYTPSSIPSTLDNILSDAFFACLDPITRLKFDEWTHLIEKSLNSNYLPNIDNQTRVEIAREKILLLIYLQKNMPDMMTQEDFLAETKEIISNKALNNFLKGGETGVSVVLMKELLLPEVMKKIPEVWTLVDRIIVNLVDNLPGFKNKDLWITFGYPSVHIGTHDPFRIIVFALNQSEDYKTKKRPVSFKFQGGTMMLEPDHIVKPFSLDPSRDFKIKSEQLPFLSKEKEDIVGSLSQILQIGDALWMQFKATRVGPHILNVDVEEELESRFSRSAIIDVKRDLRYFLKSYGGRVTALSGVMLPMFKVLLAGLGIGFLFG